MFSHKRRSDAGTHLPGSGVSASPYPSQPSPRCSSLGYAQAHVLKDFGPYSVALGWVQEPTYVGQLNAVQVVVKDASGKAVVDIGDGDLKVVVSVGGQNRRRSICCNKYDPDTGLGVPG